MNANTDEIITHAMDGTSRDVERASTRDALNAIATASGIQDGGAAAGTGVHRTFTARTNTLLSEVSDGVETKCVCVWRTCRVLPLKHVRAELQARRDLIKMCASEAPSLATVDTFSTPSKSVHFEIMLDDLDIDDVGGDQYKRACPALIARAMLERIAGEARFGEIGAETISRELVSDQTNAADDAVVDSEAHEFREAFYTRSAVVVPYASRMLENQRIVLFARLSTPMCATFDSDSGGDIGPIRFVCLVLGGESMPPAKNAYATSHTMATLLSDETFVAHAIRAENKIDIRVAVAKFIERTMQDYDSVAGEEGILVSKQPCNGILSDVQRRFPWYISDWTDGFDSWRSFVNLLSTTVWVFSSTLIPCLALGLSLQQDSARQMTHVDFLMSEALCNMIFAIIGGQALLVLRTSGPTTTFIKVMRYWARALGADFVVFYLLRGSTPA